MSSAYVDPSEASALWAGEDDPAIWTSIAIDPGGVSGWSVFGVHPDAMSGDPEVKLLGPYGNILWWTAGQFVGEENDQIDELVELIGSWPSARLVTEDFKLRQATGGRELLAPERINAVLSWAVRPRYFVKQMASLAMSTVTDDRQKDWGFWLPGQEHARDAVKHNLTFLRRRREVAIREREATSRRAA